MQDLHEAAQALTGSENVPKNNESDGVLVFLKHDAAERKRQHAEDMALRREELLVQRHELQLTRKETARHAEETKLAMQQSKAEDATAYKRQVAAEQLAFDRQEATKRVQVSDAKDILTMARDFHWDGDHPLVVKAHAVIASALDA